VLHTGQSGVRERLLAAAFEAAVAGGVDAVSTRAVCAAARVQDPALYHHFGNRVGLVSAVVDRAFEEYFARKDNRSRVASTPAHAVAAGWDAHVAFARAYPGRYPAMYPMSGKQSAHLEHSSALLRAGFDQLARDEALAPGITPQLATSALRAALRGVAHAVAADPCSPHNDFMSATVRDAMITRLINPRQRTAPND